MVKAGCRESLLPQVIEGGIRARWKHIWGIERAKLELGAGRVVRWNRRAVLRYTQLRVVQGDVREWRRTLRVGETLCRLCRVEVETGTHVVFGCEESYKIRSWAWTL